MAEGLLFPCRCDPQKSFLPPFLLCPGFSGASTLDKSENEPGWLGPCTGFPTLVCPLPARLFIVPNSRRVLEARLGLRSISLGFYMGLDWLMLQSGIPGGASGKESACQCWRRKRNRFNPWVRKIPWRRKWQPTPVFLPGESHGQRSLMGYSPWSQKESDMTEVTWHNTRSQGK